MAVFEKDLEKINTLNFLYSKKNIKAELLQLTSLANDSNYKGVDIQYELDINLENRYLKNKEFLSKINQNHYDFFVTTFKDLSDKTNRIFKENEKLLCYITQEKNELINSLISTDSQNSQYYINKLYLNSSFDETTDLFNGHFLFNKRIIQVLDGNNETFKIEDKLKITNKVLNSINNFIVTYDQQTNNLTNLDKFKLVLKNINSYGSNMSDHYFRNINYFSRDYLSQLIDLQDNGYKISNIKNYPITMSSLTQSIYNLIEQENNFSSNALVYGIIPVTKTKKFNTSLILNYPIFQKSFSNEYFPIKYLNRKDILSIENKNFRKDMTNNLILKLNDSNISKMLSRQEKLLFIDNDKFINNNFKESDLNKSINISNSNDIDSFSNISIQNKSKTNYLQDRDIRYTKFNNKFNIFKNRYINANGSSDNKQPILYGDDSDLVSDTLIKENYELYKEFKSNAKITALNFLQLIASKIDSKNLKIFSTNTQYTSAIFSTIPNAIINNNDTTAPNTNLSISNNIQSGQIIQNNNSRVSNLELTGVSGVKSRGAIPRSLQDFVIKNTNPMQDVTNAVGTNINNLTSVTSQVSQNESSIYQVLYRSKNLINENIKGLLNFSFFNENESFSSNIIKNRYLIDDANKKAKKILLNSILRINLLNSSSSNLNDHIFLKQNDMIIYSINTNISNVFSKYENIENGKNVFNNQYIEDSLSFLREKVESDHIVLNKKYILKNDSFMNESSIKYNLDNFINKNDELVDLSKNLSEDDFKQNYTNENLSFFDSYFDNNLKHFSNSNETFNFIVNSCKEYISSNLPYFDNRLNFTFKANIVETGCLLWALSTNATSINKLEQTDIKNKLTDILLYENIMKKRSRGGNLSNRVVNEIKNIKKELLLKIMTPDHISDISGFYVYSPDLNADHPSNFNPYKINENNPHDLYKIFEQNGLFYHFLFSNEQQSKNYKYSNNQFDPIIEYDNNFNIFNAIFSPLCFFQNDINDNIQFLNVFNSGYKDNSNSNNLSNIFLPYIEYSIINDKPVFIVSLKADDTKDFVQFKINLRLYLNGLKTRYQNEENIPLLYIKNIDELIQKLDNNELILNKNILNKSDIQNSFLNSTENESHFLTTFTNELFNFDNLTQQIENLNENIVSFDVFRNIKNNNIINEMRNILENSLISCSDIYSRMFIELQSYNSLCNRIFHANFFYSNELIGNQTLNALESINDINNLNNVYYNFIKGTRFLDLIDRDSDLVNYKNVIKFNSTRFIDNYFENINISTTTSTQDINNQKNNQLDLESKSIMNSEAVYNKIKDLRPSEHKFFYFLEKILGIKNEDILKIYSYIKTNPNIFSKNVNIFENFNLYFFPLERIVKLSYNENDKIIDFNKDISTYIYDFQFENAIYSGKDNDINIFGKEGKYKIAVSPNQFYNNISDINEYKTQILNALNIINENTNNANNQNIINARTYILESLKIAGNKNEFNQMKNFQYENIISLKDIFEYIIVPSYSLNQNYYNNEYTKNGNLEEYDIISGCENIIEDKNYLNLMNNMNIIKNKRYRNNEFLYKNILENYFKAYGGYQPSVSINLNKKSVDLSHNWYNQISRGLVLNDLITSMNMDLIKYYNLYENGLGKDTWIMYQKLKSLRENTSNKSGTIKENVYNIYEYLRSNSTIYNYKLKQNNFNLKKSYVNNFIQSKKMKNIQEIISTGGNSLNNSNISEFINNIISNVFSAPENINSFINSITTNSIERNLILSNFKDFYLQKIKNQGKNIAGEYKFLTNYSQNQNKNYIVNQAKNLKNCDILTIGIENNEINFENNDIVVVTVEMIDHDYPSIIWESKKFEFDMSLDDVPNEILQLEQKYRTTEFVLNQISGSAIDIPLLDYNILENEESQLGLEKLINEVSGNINENYSNNIGSLLLNEDEKIGTNVITNFVFYLNKRKQVLVEKFNKFKIINNLQDSEFSLCIDALIKKCIYNQKMNLKLKKFIKLKTGFESNIEFSLKQNESLQDLIVLDEIYELFVNNIFSNLDNSYENSLGFTFDDFSKAFQLEELDSENVFTLFDYNFKIASLTSNQNINVLIKFMSDLTRAIIPVYDMMSESNFRKIMNVVVKPSDFVVVGIQNENINDFVQNTLLISNDLIIEPISNSIILDEWENEYDILNRKIFEKNNIALKYYKLIKNSNVEKVNYIPKNISYRIKVDLLD